MPNFKDIAGQRSGRLIAVTYVGQRITNPSKPALWLVRCDCGTEKVMLGYSISNGSTKSCGCLQKELAAAQCRKFIKDKHANWKGGRHIYKSGYVKCCISYVREHYPDAVIRDPRGTTEHIAAMSHHLKRALYPNETVHHKDGDRTNNNIDNLELRVGNHGPGQTVEEMVAWANEILRRYT